MAMTTQPISQRWRERLLPLPRFLAGPGDDGDPEPASEIIARLRLTGYFLERHASPDPHRGMPAARTRLADRLRRGLDVGKA